MLMLLAKKIILSHWHELLKKWETILFYSSNANWKWLKKTDIARMQWHSRRTGGNTALDSINLGSDPPYYLKFSWDSEKLEEITMNKI